jgi:hypothetical protein
MVLSQKESDVQMLLAADAHLGTKNCDFQMERYVWKRRSDGMFSVVLLCFCGGFIGSIFCPALAGAVSLLRRCVDICGRLLSPKV